MPDPGHLASAYAAQCATTPGSPGYVELSGPQCWHSVILCWYRSGAIDENRYLALKNGWLAHDNFSALIGLRDPVVRNAFAMHEVPQGSFLGFIEVKQFQPPKLIHSMIATGHGCAAGNKNGCIGIGKGVGWEILNLREQLTWFQDTYCINAVPPGFPGQRLIELHYRPL
jgi:hypothetical protein